MSVHVLFLVELNGCPYEINARGFDEAVMAAEQQFWKDFDGMSVKNIKVTQLTEKGS